MSYFKENADDLKIIARGMLANHRHGSTPHEAHVALIRQFTKNGGRTNDFFASLISTYKRPYRIKEQDGVLQPLSPQAYSNINASLREDGYYIFPERLPAAFCDKIAERIADKDYIVRDDNIPYDPAKLHKYDRNALIAHNYMLPNDEITDVPEVQELVADPVLINVAQNYLNSKAIFSGMSLYWSAAVRDKPDDQSAQTFHWDMERIKWLRYFICLTDVTIDSGPHCFIKGSHRTGALPQDIYQRGYVRHRDEDILRIFGADSYREFVSPKGTIVAEDSRGLHKGKVLKKGERLMLAFELSSSLFGSNKRHNIRTFHSERFKRFASKYPTLYQNFDFS
jgi:ectoine hydroxylase-related dioxygenase (phytanoyl-CoA dioxygenase family)